MKKESENIKLPLVTQFFENSNYLQEFIEDDEMEEKCVICPETGALITHEGVPLWAALFKRPPTSANTPGRQRPGGFNKNGKYLPSKWIPSKMDKRAGK